MTISRWLLGVLGLAVLLLVAVTLTLAATDGSSPPPRVSAAPAHLPACTPKAAPSAPGMQLAARTSVGTGVTAQAWAETLLRAMDDPATAADVASMLAWFSAEDDSKAAGQQTYGAGENNPLNITADSGDNVGVTGTEPSGAGPSHPGNLDFSSPDYGIAATAQVIVTKYPAINQALLTGRGLIRNPAVAAELAKWSGEGYSSLPQGAS